MTQLNKPSYVSDDDDDFDFVNASISLQDNEAAVSDMSSSAGALPAKNTATSGGKTQGDLPGGATTSAAVPKEGTSEPVLQHVPPMPLDERSREVPYRRASGVIWGTEAHGKSREGAQPPVPRPKPARFMTEPDVSGLAYGDAPSPQRPSSSSASPSSAALHRLQHQKVQEPSAEPDQQSFMDGMPGMEYTKSMYKKYWDKDMLIAVMGMTGSGKTTFISKVTGRKDLKIGHNLTSCTRDIEVVETKINGQVVRFVDTPGFSDTNLSDTEVLQMIADYLAAAYKQKAKLSGIIYLHPISDNRVTHHSTKNLEMFRYLTGEKNLKNVVLATSMWDKVTEAEGAQREKELKDKFWKLLLTFGAQSMRHDGTAASAKEVALSMLKNEPFYLQLQEEMGKQNLLLKDTKAGSKVMEEILQMKEEHQRELAEMDSMIKSFKSSADENKSVIEALREEYQKQVDALQKTLTEERQMNERGIHELNERIKALENKGGCEVM